MISIYYSICVVILILGLVRGNPRADTLSFTSVSVTVLFWVSVVGIAAVLASVAGVIGIAATFDEHTDSANGFDTLCTASQQIVGICFVVALLAHGITAIWRIWPKKEAVL